ncbi:hypothetical protein Q5P01_004985 [Channa striata]|uniref:Uncharacterized protein n=1 Tax=Channa striata TaxID=64152 RepID=A0AA88NHN4_CHASR|nr:hypothetical protein Q5P01_004985 [Channa striata]
MRCHDRAVPLVGTRCPGCFFSGDCEVEGKRSCLEPCGERPRRLVGEPGAESDSSRTDSCVLCLRERFFDEEPKREEMVENGRT